MMCILQPASIPLQDAQADPAREQLSSFQHEAKAPARVQQIEENVSAG